MKTGKIVPLLAPALLILACPGCGETMEEALASGIIEAVSTVVCSIVTGALETVLGV
jgi:hypothetical protein